MMLTLTFPFETPLHRLPAGAKLAALCLVTLLLFRVSGLVPLAFCAMAVAALHGLGGIALLRRGAAAIRPLWPFAAVLVIWHGVTGDLAGGAVILLRLATAVAAANLVTMTTRLDAMIAVIERLAAPLAILGLPPRRLALAIALVIRFIPVLSGRLAQIRDAWRARSPGGPGWRILVPATLAALDDADRVAEALRARGGAG
jgi:biotin transport system permease protein